MKITRSAVDAAYKELEEKTLAEIHRETAVKWLARGLAAVRHHDESGDESWLSDAEDYFHEALEHAALALEGPLCADTRAVVERIRAIAKLQDDDLPG